MVPSLLEILDSTEIALLKEKMNWIIPEDSSVGGGSEVGLLRLSQLIDSLRLVDEYKANITGLTRADLDDRSNPFATSFIEHVRDVYYAYPETGSWADIGFKVTG